MKEWLNKRVLIKVKVDNNILFFTATVKDITDLHITFIDKFDETHTYLISDVIQISEKQEGGSRGY